MSVTKFCGTTVESISCGVGWNEQSSSLTVSLVEDTASGDRFAPPTVGTPVVFDMGNFHFEGIVQHYGRGSGMDGIHYQVIVNDPREVLDGVRVIVDSLTTPPPIPNVINAYGYWENKLGFGGALTNGSGMLWSAPFDLLKLDTTGGFSITEVATVGIKPAIELLTKGGSNYGGPIRFRGHEYTLNLSGLPAPPPYYRIGGTYPTLLELITQLCQDAGCDYMIKLAGNVIKVITVSRTSQPSIGTIGSYVSGVKDAIQRQYGVELRNDITNAMLIGGQVQNLYQVPYDGNQSVWPYWGKDIDGNIIVGTGDPLAGQHEVMLNASAIADIIGDTKYHVTTQELRCATSESGFESWAFYVMKYEPDKAQAIGLVNSIDSDSDLADLFPDVMFRRDLIAVGEEDLKQFGLMNESDYWTTRANRVFDFVRQAATEYFGVKFLVRIPFFVYWKVTPETLEIVTSDEISDGGYLPENAQPLGLGYLDINQFLTDDGRFECFVKFPADRTTNLAGMSPDGAVVSNGNLYVKATADRDLGIVYPQGSTYPYIAITLDQPVFGLAPDPLGGAGDVADLLGVDEATLYTAVAVRHGSFPVRIGPAPYFPQAVAVPMKSNRQTYGPWGTFSGNGSTGTQGVPGKTHVEHNDDMTPWAFGGYDVMNQAASAQLAGAVTNMQESETGSVEIAGLPVISIGDSLVAGGPNVTSIDCRVSTSGTTTSYSMRTYTPTFGAFQRQNADRLRRLGIAAMQMRRRMRAAFQRLQNTQEVRYAATLGSVNNTANAVRQATPKDTLYSTMTYSPKYGYRTQASISTVDEFMANVRGDNDEIYWATGGMSMEGLIRPFATATSTDDAGDMPHFEIPADWVDEKTPSADSINPIKDSDIDILVSGLSYSDVGTIHRLKPRVQRGRKAPSGPANAFGGKKGPIVPGAFTGGFSDPLLNSEEGGDLGGSGDVGDSPLDYETARGVGLRSPLILVGWGTEYTGKPLPNTGDETETVDHWDDTWIDKPAQHPEKWRAGPLLVAWDNWRKGWTFPTMLEGTLDAQADGTTGGMMTIKVNGTAIGDKVKVYGSLGTVPSGAKVIVVYNPLENKWKITAASCS